MKKLLASLLMAFSLASFAQYISLPGGMYYPSTGRVQTAGTALTLDATNEAAAAIGYASFIGQPTAAQTFGNTAKVGFYTGTAVTWADATSAIEICIMPVGTGGPMGRPDTAAGCKGWKRTINPTGGADPFPLAASSYYEVTLSQAGGSDFTVTQGDLIAVVFTMTNRGGVTDSVTLQTYQGLVSSASHLPTTNAFIAGAWQTTAAAGAGNSPTVTFTSSTPLLGTLAGSSYMGLTATSGMTGWANSVSPRERGMEFTVPAKVKVDALWTSLRPDGTAAADFTLTLYENCEGIGGTQAAISGASVAVDGATLGATSGTEGLVLATLAAPVVLSPGITYCMATLATSTGTLRSNYIILGDAAHRSFYTGGTSMKAVTRNDTGNFGTSLGVAGTNRILLMGVRISELSAGSAAGF